MQMKYVRWLSVTNEERLKAIREEKGISQYKLSKLSGVTQAHISNYERGERKAGLAILQKVCPVLGVTVSDFLSEQVTAISEEHKSALPGSIERSGQRKAFIELIDEMPDEVVDRFLNIAREIVQLRGQRTTQIPDP